MRCRRYLALDASRSWWRPAPKPWFSSKGAVDPVVLDATCLRYLLMVAMGQPAKRRAAALELMSRDVPSAMKQLRRWVVVASA